MAAGAQLEELKALKQAEHATLIAKIAQLEAQAQAESGEGGKQATSQELEALTLELEAVGAELEDAKELKQMEHGALTQRIAQLESQADAEAARAEGVVGDLRRAQQQRDEFEGQLAAYEAQASESVRALELELEESRQEGATLAAKMSQLQSQVCSRPTRMRVAEQMWPNEWPTLIV
eukprot:1178772-Prorocentrum_minimum.AAC.1